jgi:ZIP family zinc transporter
MSEIFWIIFLIFVGQTMGSLIGVVRRPSKLVLRCALAFAGSMMVAISFLELIPEALEIVNYYLVLFGFLVGILIIMGADKLLPHINPELNKKEGPNMKRCATMLVIGIALHNIPEGLAIGFGFALNPALGILIALGIAVQDIPENIATVVPLYCVTKRRLKSMGILIGTILFELLGFILGYFVLQNAPLSLLGVSLALAAGFMVYISVEELIPAAEIKKNPYHVSASILLGFLIVLAMILLM